jgi:erythromycin esterase-like protein
MSAAIDSSAETIRNSAIPLVGAKTDYDPLLAMIGDAKFVLLGEATHGTHEFYRERAQITKRLIKEKGFGAVALEADWPDSYRVNRFVRGVGEGADLDSEEALRGFGRFPTWMWRNADMLDFVGWLREFNDHIEDKKLKVGVYGMDLYSLNASIEAVLAFLKKIDPEEARRARARYSCFENFGILPESYVSAVVSGQSCEEEVIRQLVELRRRASEYSRLNGKDAVEDFFFAEQNARLVKNAEQYYRSMYRGRASSWNMRDQHMVETLEAVVKYLSKNSYKQKLVVWAHNSHLGDARATQMAEIGEFNVGQLMREKFGKEVVLVGFTTFRGSVTAASEWDQPAERKRINEALPESYEALFHENGNERFFLNLRDNQALRDCLAEPRLERAIGVIYSPQTERISHYFQSHLSQQFDAVLHFDETRAVEPLERNALWKSREVPETFPFSV